MNPTPWSIAYHSGMSSQSDFRACINTGAPAGVVAGLLTTQQLFGAIPRFIREGGSLFIDSGAFTAFRKGEPMEWKRVFQVYDLVISTTDGSPNVSIVAPDVVADQQATFALWKEHRDLIRFWIDSGVRVIVPLQTGPMPADQLLQAAIELLGTDRFCAGIPSNEAAMSPAECSLLRHHDFHILGRVKLNDEIAAKVAALKANSPEANLTADANWLRSRTRKAGRLREAMPIQMFESRRTQAVTHLLREEGYALGVEA
ncbi:TPA: hypothetical protein SL557_000178 [Pseudomonas aeruginosa]|nr:hypothetical protein [Pseudomonas aeruginosa]